MRIGKKAIIAAIAAIAIATLAGCQSELPNVVNSPEDVQGSNIGVLRGTPSVRLANEIGIAHIFTSGEEMMAHLRAGTIDCAVMESVTAAELVEETPGVRILSEPMIEYDLRFAIPRENAALLTAVNTALAALHQNGTLSGLSRKYFAGRSFTYEPPEGVEQRPGYLSLALPSDSPPFSFINANGEFVGLDVEVAQAVCDYLGVELRLMEVDVLDLITTVWFGQADMAMGWLPIEGDEELISKSDPYANAVYVVVVRR